MKTKHIYLCTLLALTSLAACKKHDDDDDDMGKTQSFTVKIENIQTPYTHFESGVFSMPMGSNAAGPAFPGHSYQFTVHGGPGTKLSFATMYGASNDLFFAPDGMGINLFNGNTPVTGDVTSQIYLWDAGTEVNEMPGNGPNQPANQSGPNTGPDEHGTVRMISDVSDGYSYPDVANTIKVTLATGADINEFVVTIENLSGSPTPISPGAWVIHTGDNPLFTEMMTEPGHGLEHQAEDGDPTTLADYLAGISGLNTPLAPGIFVVHKSNRMPLFTDGNAASAGIEALAEDGNPTVIDMALDGMSDITKGIFSMPDGGSSAGPLFPGHSFTFMFKASKGDRLSFGSMFGQSNDIFFGFDDKGLALWKGNTPVSGDVTSYVKLWDAGTEVNERPGLGINQAPRQSGPNTGPDENGVVMQVNDGFTYPSVGQLVKVTITPN